MVRRPIAVAALVLAVLVGCERKQAAAPPPAKQYAVQETFGTGAATVVRALKVDGPQLWVGTSVGIIQVDRKSGNLIKTFTIDDGLSSNYIFGINVDPSGIKWFGTDAGGLMRYDGSEWRIFTEAEGVADPWVYDIAFHPDGSLWVGTWDGVSRYDGKAFTSYRVKDGLANKWCYAVAVDKDGSLWFGTEEGVSRFDGSSWKTYTHADGLGAPNALALAHKKTAGELQDEAEKSGITLAPGRAYEGHFHDLTTLDDAGKETYNENYIFSAIVDRYGNKWFGTWGGGLSRFDGKAWTNYTMQEGLAGNIVYVVREGRDGAIWVGTNRGLSRFDGTHFKNFTTADKLVGDDVFAIDTDEDSVWIGQRGGVVRLKEQKAT